MPKTNFRLNPSSTDYSSKPDRPGAIRLLFVSVLYVALTTKRIIVAQFTVDELIRCDNCSSFKTGVTCVILQMLQSDWLRYSLSQKDIHFNTQPEPVAKIASSGWELNPRPSTLLQNYYYKSCLLIG